LTPTPPFGTKQKHAEITQRHARVLVLPVLRHRSDAGKKRVPARQPVWFLAYSSNGDGEIGERDMSLPYLSVAGSCGVVFFGMQGSPPPESYVSS